MTSQIISDLASTLNHCVRLVREQAIWIALLSVALIYLKRELEVRRGAVNPLHRNRPFASQDSGTNAVQRSEDDLREEMRRVRLRQQELAAQNAAEAEKKRKEKAAKERERRNAYANASTLNGGHKLGGGGGTTDSTSSSTGFNPMQPWSSSSSSYRPTRRTVRRG